MGRHGRETGRSRQPKTTPEQGLCNDLPESPPSLPSKPAPQDCFNLADCDYDFNSTLPINLSSAAPDWVLPSAREAYKNAVNGLHTLVSGGGWWGNELDAEEAIMLILEHEFGNPAGGRSSWRGPPYPTMPHSLASYRSVFGRFQHGFWQCAGRALAAARTSWCAVACVLVVPLPLFGFQPYLPPSLFFLLASPKRKNQRKG